MVENLSDDVEADGKADHEDDKKYSESKATYNTRDIVDNDIKMTKLDDTQHSNNTRRKSEYITDVDGKIDITRTQQNKIKKLDQKLNPLDADVPQVDYSIWSTISQITATLILNFLNFNYGMVVIMPTLLVGTLDSVTVLNETRLASPQLVLNEMHASWLGEYLYAFFRSLYPPGTRCPRLWT